MGKSNILFWLTIILVVLKLVGVINISWLWVTFLFWAPLAVLAILVILMCLTVSYHVIKYLIFQYGKEK